MAYWFLKPQAQTAGRARRLARQAMTAWDLEEQADAAEPLAGRYAERPITLRLLRTDVLRCEVGDDAPLLPRMRHAMLEEEGGRGLYLVDHMAQRWGATRLGADKVVWFELPIGRLGDPLCRRVEPCPRETRIPLRDRRLVKPAGHFSVRSPLQLVEGRGRTFGVSGG